jgi:nitroreductase
MNRISQEELYLEIFRRKSVRRFENREIDKELADTLRTGLAETAALTSTPAALQIFPAREAGVSFGGAPCCLGVYAENDNTARLNAAFMLKGANLMLSVLGLGSCWVGLAKPKGSFTEYQGLPFFKLIAFGYPAEPSRRNSPEEFKRKSLQEITNIQGRDTLLEALRLAPSALNRQNWYLSASENKIRLYMAGDNFLVKKLMEPLTIADAGIALCHLHLSAQHSGGIAASRHEDGIGGVKKNCSYVWTVEVKT